MIKDIAPLLSKSRCRNKKSCRMTRPNGQNDFMPAICFIILYNIFARCQESKPREKQQNYSEKILYFVHKPPKSEILPRIIKHPGAQKLPGGWDRLEHHMPISFTSPLDTFAAVPSTKRTASEKSSFIFSANPYFSLAPYKTETFLPMVKLFSV